VSRAFGNRDLKQFVISEPETHTYQIRASDELLILSTDGLYKTFSTEYVAEMVYRLRRAGLELHEIAEKVVLEAQQPHSDFKRCSDNVTLLIVNLHAYFTDRSDYRQPRSEIASVPQRLLSFPARR
jgi:serine/threonine protein phosphatase PrpC